MNDSTSDKATLISPWRSSWKLREGTTYLNHGSFGPPPEPVRAARQQWQERLDHQPMDFFFREAESAWWEARRELARFVGTAAENLVFVDNATYAMNVVARSFELAPDDQVVLTDHEYGAVQRIWRRACEEAGACEPIVAELPWPVATTDQVLDAIAAKITDKTRMLVVSHITSPTACILPVPEICRMARERGVATCVDGPHAIVQIPLDVDGLGCDFYTASCHKWLSAPFGCGFLYVSPARQDRIHPPVLSWGRLPPETHRNWADEFPWLGTRDPSPFLAVTAAIEFIEAVGLDTFRQHTHALASYAREQLSELTGLEPATPDSVAWYGSMINTPLPAGDPKSLQDRLWERHQIEIPIVSWKNRRSIRVSCHLYNHRAEIDLLIEALKDALDCRGSLGDPEN